jgi:Xaa-Pro aminopeptidase
MTDVLIFGDTERSQELRHEIPLLVPDPFLYLEVGGKRMAVVSSMEQPRIADAAPDVELHPVEEFGYDELVAQGLPYERLAWANAVRAVKALGVTKAVVPRTFPLELADELRAEGVELAVDRELFNDRRRRKTDAEVAGIKRAQKAAEAGMRAATELLRAATPGDDGVLQHDGQPLTCERVKAAILGAFIANGATSDEFIVAAGWQGAMGHHMGEGPIRAGQPLVIDIWPKDNESACFSDMTRTFVVGEVEEETAAFHSVVKESLDRAIAAIRDGVDGRSVFEASCEPFHERGYPTQLTKKEGEILRDGFFHGLGHGVGLAVHEQPGMSRGPGKLREGDIVTVEPGCYRQGYGGVRLEDIVLVTKDGCEKLTDFPYDLAP